MIIYRVKFKNIISELFIPEKHNGTTVVFVAGLPSYLSKNEITKSLVADGCVVFQPFYTGSYDSKGNFSPDECVKDIKKFADLANSHELKELYYSKKIKLQTKKVVLMGTSFGSSIAISSDLSKYSKLVLLSPVLTYDQKYINNQVKGFDFKSQATGLINLLTKAYPYTYRIKNISLWKQYLFKDGQKGALNSINKVKIPTLVIHGKKDTSVPASLTEKILESSNNINLALITPEVSHSINSYDRDTIQKIVGFINK